LLFSEMGMWPVKYRRIILALRYWQYALTLPEDHFLSITMVESLTLAHAKKSSWISNLAHVLHLLHRPVSMDLSRQWLPSDIDNLITAVEQSCLMDIDAFIAVSSKALLLRYRSLHQTDPSSTRKTPMASSCSYLNVPIFAHKKALVRLLTSSHTLAIEVLRWSDRHCPPVPCSQHLCRFYLSEVEDEAHALWYCNGSQSLDICDPISSNRCS
ncbi:hypothetical protein ARMGADRAFT_937995, partial [Armillaria gallica]